MGPWVGRAAVNESVCKQRGETWRSVFLEGITLAYWGNNLFPQYVSTLAVTSMLQPQTSATRIWAGHSSMTGSSAPDGQGRGLRVKAAPAISASDRASLLGVKLQASSFSFVAFLSPLFPLFPVTLSREEALECQVLKPQPVRLQDQHPQAQNSEKRGTASFPYYSGSPAPRNLGPPSLWASIRNPGPGFDCQSTGRPWLCALEADRARLAGRGKTWIQRQTTSGFRARKPGPNWAEGR